MKPTILEGDSILVNKMAYDLRLPFTHISLLKHADPARGEIDIIDSEAALHRRWFDTEKNRIQGRHEQQCQQGGESQSRHDGQRHVDEEDIL